MSDNYSTGTVTEAIRKFLNFGPEKCLKESRVWSYLEKASLVHFFFSSNFLITCQKASLVHIQIARKGKFGPDSEKNTGPNLPFANIFFTWLELFKKGKFGPVFSPNLDQTCLLEQFECGPNLPFDMWSKNSKRKKVDQTCLFEVTPHVTLDSFKHFSGPKFKTYVLRLTLSQFFKTIKKSRP